MVNSFRRLALKTTLIYGAVAAAWIGFSDTVVPQLIPDPELAAQVSMMKGWAFVLLTAVLLYALLMRGMLRLERETEARLDTETERRQWMEAFEHCPIGIAVGSPTGNRILTCNPEFARLHGVAAVDLAGVPLPSLIDPASHPQLEQEMVAASRLDLRRFESTLIRKNGEALPIELTIVGVADGTGALSYFLTSIQDIGERKRADAALRESEARFRQVVESIREVFWMTTADGLRTLYVSPRYEEVFGLPCAPLYEDAEAWTESVAPEDRDRVRAARQCKFTDGTYDEEFRISLPDGAVRWIRDRAFAARDTSGKVDRIVGIAEDITQRKNLEAQFLRAQRLEAIGTLSSGIAHDLNNILAPIMMVVSLLKENVTAAADREMLELVETGAQRGANIIKQLLTFSRGIGGDRGLVQTRHLVREIAALMRETFPREIQIDEATGPELPPVLADATQLSQVLMNLCVNARDAMPGGGKLTVGADRREITGADAAFSPQAKPGDYVVLSVADTGEGIAPELLDRIFEPFFTTKEIGKGTGLGLSTVAGIAKSHGGFVTVKTEVTKGSIFEVYLPTSGSDEGIVNSHRALQLPRGRNQLILIVDDEAAIRETLGAVLERSEYRVVTAANGQEALTLFLEQRSSIRLVLTDMMMPVMNGPALIRSLRALEPTQRILPMSGLHDYVQPEDLREFGVATILLKPATPSEALAAVHRALTEPQPVDDL